MAEHVRKLFHHALEAQSDHGICGKSLGPWNGRFSRGGEDHESGDSGGMGLSRISDPALRGDSAMHIRAHGRIYRPHAIKQQPTPTVRDQINI